MATLTRKHFISAANILSEVRACADTAEERDTVDKVTQGFANYFQYENSYFDRGRFYEAADYDGQTSGVQA